MTYADKLKDPRWQKKRLRIMERDGFRCRDCFSDDKPLQVHHCQYEKAGPWATDDDLLITVCKDCHKERGELEDIGKRSLARIFARTRYDGGDSGLSGLVAELVHASEKGYACQSIVDTDELCILAAKALRWDPIASTREEEITP